MNDGLITKNSAHDFPATLRRLLGAVQRRRLTLFAVVDHADGAELAGLELAPSTLVVFGNAKGGTPLMQQNPRAGLDLPLKALVWQEAAGVRVSVTDPAWIAARHGLDPKLAGELATVLKAVVEEACGD